MKIHEAMALKSGDTIDVNGVAHVIDSVQYEPRVEGDRLNATWHIRTLPAPEVIEFTLSGSAQICPRDTPNEADHA